MIPSEPNNPPWLKLAAFALRSAIDEDFDAAGRAVTQIARTYGNDEIPHLLCAFIDSFVTTTGAPVPDAFAFQAVETGFVTNADGVSPRVRWAGRLIMARAAMDHEQFFALIDSVQSDEEWSTNCSAVLELCALNIRRHQEKEAARG